MTIRSRRWLPAIAAALTLTGLIVVAPITAAADDDLESCSLSANAHAPGEWASCLSVGVELASLPAVGEAASMTFTVTAEFARSSVRIEARLPDGIGWNRLPAGFAATEPHRASGVFSFAAGEIKRFDAEVLATATGPADIAVSVHSPTDAQTAVPTDHVYLTIAERGGTSTPGMAGPPSAPAVLAGTGGTRVAPDLGYKPVRRAGPVSLAAPPPLVQACVTGSWGYVDSANIVRVSPNYGVEVWDRDSNGETMLVTGVTNGSGAYTLCFDNADIDNGQPAGGQDVFVRHLSDNDQWRVQAPGTGLEYHYDSTQVNNVANGSTVNFGFAKPGDPQHQLGVQAFDAIDDLWNWIPGDCWDDLDVGPCKKMVINWRWDAGGNNFYNNVTRQVMLNANGPKSRDVTVHEGAHAVMDDVYEFSSVPGQGVQPHGFTMKTNAGAAWVEGFAEWVPLRVYNETEYHWEDGINKIELETPTWHTTGWPNDGDQVEGRVVGALHDLSDIVNETPWDRLAEGAPGNIWWTFLHHKSNSFAQFWGQRTADGFNVSPTGGLGSLYQNTIDYTFRDPLAGNTPVLRPKPKGWHNFSYSTIDKYWSVVAIRPAAGTDNDLKLFDDKAQTVQKALSSQSGSVVDFIAVDSNTGLEPLGDFYPRVTPFSGAGDYRIEVALGASTLTTTPQSIGMSSGKVVTVRDINLAANVPVTITVTPVGATQDAELFLVRSTAAQHFINRGQVFASSTSAGPGGAESITVTPVTGGWYGVVLINKSGSGTYTLKRT